MTDIFRTIIVPSALAPLARSLAGAPVTLSQCTALVSQSDVSADPPFAAFGRLGMQLVWSNLP